jgi:hypothetical protein
MIDLPMLCNLNKKTSPVYGGMSTHDTGASLQDTIETPNPIRWRYKPSMKTPHTLYCEPMISVGYKALYSKQFLTCLASHAFPSIQNV